MPDVILDDIISHNKKAITRHKIIINCDDVFSPLIVFRISKITKENPNAIICVLKVLEIPYVNTATHAGPF